MAQSAANKYVKFLPIQVGVILCILVAILWWHLDSQRDKNLRNLIDIRVNELSSILKADIRSRVPSLQRIAQRWSARGGTPKAEFLQDINAYLKDLPGFKALGWVDKHFYVRWIAPLKGNEKAMNLNLAFEKNRRISLEDARDKGRVSMTSPINLVQGGKGFIIYIPLFVNKEFDGFISAVFLIENWIDYVFGFIELTGKKSDLKVSILINNERVYAQPGWGRDNYDDWQATSSIDVMENTVSVIVQPTEKFFKSNSTFIPETIAILGVLLSLIISVMILLLQKTNRAIAKVRDINVTLEESIESRKQAEREANKSNQAKSQFLSSMSHELRTPLNAILGFSQLLEMREEDAVKKENLNEVTNAGYYLLGLINEILDLSQIESGRLNLTIDGHNLNELLNSTLSIVKPLAEKRSIQIDNKISLLPDFTLNIDKTRFKQVLLNILSNAIKYNSKNGRVIIDCSLIEENMLQLSVSNTGEGLTPEQQNQLFIPFERIGADKSHIEGTGLGLVISKDLIELMGGEIGVESEVGKWTRFWINIPLL